MRNFVVFVAVAMLLAACGANPKVLDPCDVLPSLNPKPATSTWIVANDRPFAQEVAGARGRYQKYRCGS